MKSAPDSYKPSIEARNVFQELITLQNPKDQQIYQLLKDCGPQCREGLIKKTGYPSSTIYDALKRLMTRRLVDRFAEKTQTPGRPRVFFEISC